MGVCTVLLSPIFVFYIYRFELCTQGLTRLEDGKLEGPVVLQVAAVRNLSKPSTSQTSDGAGPRTLSLQLTDGKRTVVAVEHARCSFFSMDSTVPGCKVTVKNARVKSGTILLTPNNCTAMGGGVPKMTEEWETTRRYGNRKRRTDAVSAGAPKFTTFQNASGRTRTKSGGPTSSSSVPGHSSASGSVSAAQGHTAAPKPDGGHHSKDDRRGHAGRVDSKTERRAGGDASSRGRQGSAGRGGVHSSSGGGQRHTPREATTQRRGLDGSSSQRGGKRRGGDDVARDRPASANAIERQQRSTRGGRHSADAPRTHQRDLNVGGNVQNFSGTHRASHSRGHGGGGAHEPHGGASEHTRRFGNSSYTTDNGAAPTFDSDAHFAAALQAQFDSEVSLQPNSKGGKSSGKDLTLSLFSFASAADSGTASSGHDADEPRDGRRGGRRRGGW